jgi:hypothetical protein
MIPPTLRAPRRRHLARHQPRKSAADADHVHPAPTAIRVTARIAAFMPGASPRW